MAQGMNRGTCPWQNVKVFLETFFICNDIDKNLNKNIHTLRGSISRGYPF